MINKFIYYLKSLNEKRILLLLVGVTFALRLYAVLMAQGIAYDSAAYGYMARDFLRGHFVKGLSSPAPPFYPFLIFLFSPDTAHVEITGRFVSLFFGTVTIIPLFFLVKEAIGKRAAIFSALFYAFHPNLVTYSGMLLTEATYWGLLVLSVYFFWTGLKKEKVGRMSFSGMLLGLAYLTKPEGVGYVLVYLAWVVAGGVLRKKWLKKLSLIGVLLPSVFIFVIPYVIYIHQETGRWLISKKAVETQSQFLKEAVGEAVPSKGVEQNQPGRQNFGILRIVQNIVQFFPHVIYQYLRAYYFSLWPFLLFGLMRVRQKVIAYELFLASMVLFHLVSLSTFLPSTPRFSVPVISLSLFWAGAGVLELERHLKKVRRLNPERVIFLLTLVVILIQMPQGLKPEGRHRVGQKGVGLWLKQNTPKDAIIMSNSPHEAFYADREFMLLPPGVPVAGIPGRSYHEIIEYAKTKGVRYILVNGNTHENNPGFIESVQPRDLKEILRKADEGLIIYEVLY